MFLIYISVSRNEVISFDISYSNLIYGCFVFNSFKKFSRSVLPPVHIKNISSINKIHICRWIFFIVCMTKFASYNSDRETSILIANLWQFWEKDWALGYTSKQFWDFPKIFLRILSFKLFKNFSSTLWNLSISIATAWRQRKKPD